MTAPIDSPLSRLAQDFRAALLRREADAARRMVAAYADVWRAVQADLGKIQQQISAARTAGETIDAAWLWRGDRLLALQEALSQRLTVFGLLAGQEITQAQRDAIGLAQSHSQGLLRAALGDGPPLPFVRVPDEVLATLVGTLTDGSPLRALLIALAPATASQAGDVLTRGIVTGKGPRETARALRDVLGTTLTRALTISRTETMRAYREASLQNYRANSDVVAEWTWVAQLSPRTCAMCWAMHGTRHPLSEPFASHPNCRCVAAPATKSWAELGFVGIPDTRPTIPLGADVFAALPEDDQRAILGPGKLKLYRDGMPLSALVGISHNAQWGTGRYEKSLEAVT